MHSIKSFAALSDHPSSTLISSLCLQILATKDKDEVAESFKDDLTLTVREGQPLVLTPSQVKNMTLEDMVSIWKVSHLHSLYIAKLDSVWFCSLLIEVHNTSTGVSALLTLYVDGMQEYVNELAQGLVDVDKNPQDVVAAEKIKRLCNESVSFYLSFR